ncbi:MAG: DUF1800 domain-containing protein [Deltaproteobacteria bacterium]|nr:DUF1800 domain-containing protein [Deltaproteobacteria bacterium]
MADWNLTTARHLLRRTGFGATRADAQTLLDRHATLAGAVDELLDFKPSKFKPGGRSIEDIHNKWVKYMIKTRQPLQERLVLFWHDHFATSNDKVDDVDLMAQQNRLLRINCKGDFRALVKAVNRDAAMMEFLDTVDNRKRQPNENYARELMELFTLGVLAPTPDSGGQSANYTQEDIVQIARAFTGWDYNDKGVAELNENRHDKGDADEDWNPPRGPKVIFKQRGGFNDANGQSFDAGTDWAAEIDNVIDIIFQHRYGPNGNQRVTVADYVARRLITYFALGTPSTSFVHAVVDASGFAGTWSIEALLRALFNHDDFYLTAVAPGPATAKSVKWPIDYVVSTLRLLRMKLKSKYQYVSGGDYATIRDQLINMGQLLFEPPSVFGWDWDLAWASSATMLARYNFARDVTAARDGGGSSFRPERLIDLSLTDPGDIVDAVTDLLGIDDQLTTADRNACIAYLGAGSIDLDDYDVRNRKLHGLVCVLLQSPIYQLQ